MTTPAEPRKCLFCNRHAEPGEVLCDLCDLARSQMTGGWNVAGWMPVQPLVVATIEPTLCELCGEPTIDDRPLCPSCNAQGRRICGMKE
jgi:hypothetical protein